MKHISQSSEGGAPFEPASSLEQIDQLVDKLKQHVELSKEELALLYESKGRIGGWDVADPKLAEMRKLRKERSKVRDYAVLYDCAEEQIVTDPSLITEDVRVYIGELSKEHIHVIEQRKAPLVVDGMLHFANTEITKIPENLTFKGSVDFSKCKSLKSISPGTVFDGRYAIFEKCTALESIPADVVFNGVYANFQGCSALRVINESVKFNGDVFLAGCASLEPLPETVVTNMKGERFVPPLHLKESYKDLKNFRESAFDGFVTIKA